MRLYGKRFLKNSMDAAAADRVESRDAVVWDVLHDLRVCRVKIQGSDEYIVARYPENWEQTPSWLKSGNAVRISHRGGIRGYIEVIGHGTAVPTSTTGPASPGAPALPDAIMTGLRVIEIPNGARMAVMVLVGTYRRNGSVKPVLCIKMKSSGAVFDMKMGGDMGQVAEVFAVPTLTNYQFRIDLVYMTVDGVIGYLTGTPFNTGGSTPATPSNCYALGTVLVKKGASAIYQTDINATYSDPAPNLIDVTIADSDLSSTELTTTLTIKIKDQYGNYMTPPLAGYLVQGSITSGTGSLSTAVAQGASTGTSIKGVMTSQSVVYTYTRSDVPETSPYIEFNVLGSSAAPTTGMIILRDADNNILI